MSRLSLQIAVFLVLVVFFRYADAGLVEEPKIMCKDAERQALLKLKADLHELEDGLLSSWGNEEEKRECCEWVGIRCAKKSGHVIMLDLSPPTFGQKDTLAPMRGKVATDACLFDTSSAVSALWSLEGNVSPSSSKNCKDLVVFDVGEKKLMGPTPTWMGESLTNLVILSLRSNRFYGSMPSNLCRLSSLQLLDLSTNDISATVPKCLNNFTSMKEQKSIIYDILTTVYFLYTSNIFGSEEVFKRSYSDQIQLVWEGTTRGYTSTLGLVKSFDLSSNRLVVEIPREITELFGLFSLNLSRNHLSRQLPSDISQLTLLDFLDLSNNQLCSRLPSSLSQIAHLNELDLSNNNFAGKNPNKHSNPEL